MQKRIAVILALAGLGGFTVSAQICLLREFLALFSANEMALGTVMGMWLLFTGAGAWIAGIFKGKTGKEVPTIMLLFILSILPLMTLFSLGLWKTGMLPYGTMAGLWQIVVTGFLAFLPVCLVTGFLFVVLTSRLMDADVPGAAGRAYSFESLGGLTGGALVNFILLWFAGSFVTLRVFFVLFMILTCSYALLRLRFTGASVTFVIAGLLSALVFLFPFKQLTYDAVYKEQVVVLDKETPYGRVTITRSDKQLNYYSDGTLMFSSGNTILNEESVHYAMLQRPHPGAVLLIGGGISGTIPEILKYHPERIDYAEINPVIAGLAQTNPYNAGEMPVVVRRQDARAWLKAVENRYDVILVNVPEPSSLQLNRYYTVEFAAILKQHMTPSGVASFSLPSTADYVSKEAGKMNSVLYSTLKAVFGNVVIVPGFRNWFLASDSSLSMNIAEMTDQRMAGNQFVNSFYIDDGLLKDRSAFILKNLPPQRTVNHDFHPVIYRHQLSVWLSQFGIRWPAVMWAVAMVVLFVLLFLNRTGTVLFAGGFTGASLEVMTILAMQVALGYMISMAGVVIMTFMAGLAAGPWLARKLFREPRRQPFVLLNIFMGLMPFLMFGIEKIIESNLAGPVIAIALLLVVALAVSLILAMQYTVAVSITAGEQVRAASKSYASDLFGSALGAFLVPVVFFPVLGIGWTLGMLAGLNFVTALFFTFRTTRKNQA